MWLGTWWVTATCLVVAVDAHYDYVNAKMPEYGGGDYDASRDSIPHVPVPDYYRDQAADLPHPHETPPSDYKYEEIVKSRKRHNLDDSETWQNPSKNHKSATRNNPGFDYNSDEIDLKLSNRLPKHRPRNRVRDSQDDETVRNPARFGRYKKEEDASDINAENDFRNEDSKIDLHDENTDYNDKLNQRATTARVIRRKPRDRYVKSPVKEDEPAHTFKSDFLFEDETNPKLRAKLPSEQETNKHVGSNIQLSKPKLNQYGQYDDYYDMKRVFAIKNKLTEQDEDKDSKSNDIVSVFTPRVTPIVDSWPKLIGGDKKASRTNAEMAVTRVKQIEDTTSLDDFEVSFTELYPKTPGRDTLNKHFESPYSVHSSKQKVDFSKKTYPLPRPYSVRPNFDETDATKNYRMPNRKSYHGKQIKDSPDATENYRIPNRKLYHEKLIKDIANARTGEANSEIPNFDKQMEDEEQDSRYAQNNRQQMSEADKIYLDMSYPDSYRNQVNDTENRDFEVPNPRLNLRGQTEDSIKKDFELPKPRPNMINQMRKQPFGSRKANVWPKLGKQVNSQSQDSDWEKLNRAGQSYHHTEQKLTDEDVMNWENGEKAEQSRFQGEQKSSDDEDVKGKIAKNAKPSRLRNEWRLKENEDRSTEKFQVNDGRRSFIDSADINNIADYGNYDYATETIVPTEIIVSKLPPEKAMSKALLDILNSTISFITTTSTEDATTTTVPTTTTEALDLPVAKMLSRKSESHDVELSLAEKSRLSILKKSQRKEMLKDLGSTKPPVLMQVTNKLYTVVIVEPATKLKPWQQVREVSADSPDNLKMVKRLMRHKLIANAKNVQDLTDNWDDMVCDYVDMSIINDIKKIKSAATISLTNVYIIFLSITIHIYFSN